MIIPEGEEINIGAETTCTDSKGLPNSKQKKLKDTMPRYSK